MMTEIIGGLWLSTTVVVVRRNFMEPWVSFLFLIGMMATYVIFFGLDVHFLGIDLVSSIHGDSQPFPPSSQPSANVATSLSR